MCEKTEKQHELDKRYLRMAAIWAENSYCKRRIQWNTRRF